MDYYDFIVRISPGSAPGQFQVTARSATAGETSGVFIPPLSDTELENFVLKVGLTRRGVRRIQSPEWRVAQGFGQKLYANLFVDDIRASFLASRNDAQREGKGLRVKVIVDAPALVNYPWEYLYDPSLGRFLSLFQGTPVVRYVELASPPPALRVTPPLRVLVLASSPSDFPPLDLDREKKNLDSALAELIAQNQIVVDWLPTPSLEALRAQLLKRPYHIFHFIGHGAFDESLQDGVLLLQDESGRGRAVSGERLAVLLANHSSLRLAILNSCEGARTSAQDPFAGAAMTLVRSGGLGAVVAMQFEITDDASIAFSRGFYSGLATGNPVDAAVAQARLAIFAEGNDVEWGTPVLYLRAPDGLIFSRTVPFERVDTEKLRFDQQKQDRAQQEQLAREKADQEQLALEQAEAARIAREQAEQAREKAEQERLAQVQAEQERQAKEKAEQERIAQEKAEQERLAQVQAEQERQAKEKAEQERIAQEKAEQERLARVQAEQERQAKEKAEQERLVRLKAEQDRLERDRAEAFRVARDQAERSAQVANLLRAAQASFDQRQFQAAMRQAEQVLAIDPTNRTAKDMIANARQQILRPRATAPLPTPTNAPVVTRSSPPASPSAPAVTRSALPVPTRAAVPVPEPRESLLHQTPVRVAIAAILFLIVGIIVIAPTSSFLGSFLNPATPTEAAAGAPPRTVTPTRTATPTNTLRPSTPTPPPVTSTRLPTLTLAGRTAAPVVAAATATRAPVIIPTSRPLPTSAPNLIPQPVAPTASGNAQLRVDVDKIALNRANDSDVWDKVTTLVRTMSITNLATGGQQPIFSSGARFWYDNTLGQNVYSSAWSPDGNRLLVPYGVFNWYDDRAGKLQTLTRDGSVASVIATRIVQYAEYPQINAAYRDAIWSPDGSRIAMFYVLPDGNRCPFVLNADGSGFRKLLLCEADDYPRYWSVDGRWMVARSGRGGLYALEVDGNQRVPLAVLGGIELYDQRYYPWRVTTNPVCRADDFWSCE